MPTTTIGSDLAAQHNYVESLKSRGGDDGFPLVATEAFVRGMRDSGYKSTATSIDEFVDNSLQAEASRIDILITEGESTGKRGVGKPIEQVVVIDNGHGMEPDMIRASVRWGGTHRENDRTGLGRYGFGLPSAAVSMTERYKVFSKLVDGSWHCVGIDLKEIAEGHLTQSNGIVISPRAEEATIPDFVTKYLAEHGVELESGTIVQIDRPDRLTSGFRRYSSLEQKLMEHLGLIYRGKLRAIDIYVNGRKVEAVDPLFTTPGCRFYDIGTGVKAEAGEELSFKVKADDGSEGAVRVRFSAMPPTFIKDANGSKHKGRSSVLGEQKSFFIVCRAGRQIDAITSVPDSVKIKIKTLLYYDEFWAVELDFDPVLDEFFGITVNKQQAVVQERMWTILENQGVLAMIYAIRARSLEMRKADTDRPSDDTSTEEPRDSEKIMQKAEKFKSLPATTTPSEKKKQGEQRVIDKAEEVAKREGTSVEEAAKEILNHTSVKPYVVDFESSPGAPFFRPEYFGSQVRIVINRSHRFYDDIYSAPGATRRLKVALELFLFVVGGCELLSIGDKEKFYERERGEWSREMSTVLGLLDDEEPLQEATEANDAELDDVAPETASGEV